MMDALRIPSELHPLVALLDEWAISDDMDRSLKVENASKDELLALVAAVDAIDSAVLYGWLAGSEASSSTPSPEYLAMTCLTMAADEARVTLQQGPEFMVKAAGAARAAGRLILLALIAVVYVITGSVELGSVGPTIAFAGAPVATTFVGHDYDPSAQPARSDEHAADGNVRPPRVSA